MRRALWALLVLSLARAHGPDRTLTVFAAASLTEAFTELGDSLRAHDPGVVVQFNFAGSQLLALQLIEGAEADVFAAADARSMQAVADSGLVDDPIPFARNRLVVILPATNPARIAALRDLARPGVKIVLAGDAVPAGRYARAVVANLGQSPGFPPAYEHRVLANVVSEEENVRAVVAKVRLGEADAGIVYASDVSAAAGAGVRTLVIPDSANVLATYPIAVLHRSTHQAAARAFVALVFSPAGQRVLARHELLPIAGRP